jgi:hypothetical protein
VQGAFGRASSIAGKRRGAEVEGAWILRVSRGLGLGRSVPNMLIRSIARNTRHDREDLAGGQLNRRACYSLAAARTAQPVYPGRSPRCTPRRNGRGLCPASVNPSSTIRAQRRTDVHRNTEQPSGNAPHCRDFGLCTIS